MSDEMIVRVVNAIGPILQAALAPGGKPVELRVIARAAIEAMREPTGRMLSHGEEKFDDTRSVDHSDELASAWRTMIDAALNEKSPAAT